MTEKDLITAIRASMKLLDGPLTSSVSLLTGLSPDRINELGGTGDWEL